MIVLEPMSETEYRAFQLRAIPLYAAEKVLSGSWRLEDSLQKSHEAYENLLSDGLATRDHFLYIIRDAATAENLGVVWLGDDSANCAGSGYIYELFVEEKHRRRGIAERAMREIEAKAKSLGLETLRLHVFGQNRIAAALYAKLGYAVTDLHMAKSLT